MEVRRRPSVGLGLYLDMMAHAYDAQVHDSVGETPFSLVLSRPPPSLYIELPQPQANTVKETQRRKLVRLRKLIANAKGELDKRQARTKRTLTGG